MKNAQGFTLIEIVMTVLIASVLSMAGYHLMQFTIRNTFFLPHQVQADLVAADALEIIAEGDSQAEGLRFCKAVTTANANQVVVTNQNNQTITYSLSGGILSRTIAPGAAVMIPYFMATNMTISGAGTGGALFTYFYAADATPGSPVVPANVCRIQIDLIAQNGTGNADKYEGYSQQHTSIRVYNI